MYGNTTHHCITMLVLVVLVCWIQPGLLHVIDNGVDLNNACNLKCRHGFSCVSRRPAGVRGIFQRCRPYIPNRRILHGMQNHHTQIREERPVYPLEIQTVPTQQLWTDGAVFGPRHNTVDIEKHIQYLANSRIGMALRNTLQKQIGRQAIQFKGHPLVSIEIKESVRGTGVDDRPPSGSTTPMTVHISPSIVHVDRTTTDKPFTNPSSDCAPCEDFKCPEGKFCYLSYACGRRTCQPL